MQSRHIGLYLGVGVSFVFVSITIYFLVFDRSKRGSERRLPSGGEDTLANDRTMDFPFLTDPISIKFMKNSKVMFIMRGLPGSGKSFIARGIKQLFGTQAVICSADDFRYNDEGKYVWNKEEYEKTHVMCQEKAQQMCEQGIAVVIIDNTNIHKRRLFHYISIAQNAGYHPVLVEPKTSWKHNITELVRRNSHGVADEALRQMLSKFDPVTAIYYGWFLSDQDSWILRNKIHEMLRDCIHTIPLFEERLMGYECERQGTCPVLSENCNDSNLEHLASLSVSLQRLHVTSCFYKKEQNAKAHEYATSLTVQEAVGSVTTLSVIGWTVTQRTLVARVKLNPRQLELWRSRETDDSLAKSNLHETHETGPTISEVQNQDCPDVPITYTKLAIKPTIGRGDKAHITLSTALGVAPVQGREDLGDIIIQELANQDFKEYSIPQGIVRNYGNELWAGYLNQPIKFNALFTGHYSS